METVLKSVRIPMEHICARVTLDICWWKTCWLAVVSSQFILTSVLQDMHIIIDTNECAMMNGNCSQMCFNTIGSYVCSCNNGYQLGTNNRTCDGMSIWPLNDGINCLDFLLYLPDINECLINNGLCSTSCTNTIGSYFCSCSSGYQLNADGTTCNGM